MAGDWPARGAVCPSPRLSSPCALQTPVSLSTGSVPLSVTASLQLNHAQEDSSRCSDNSSYEEPLSPVSASSSASRRRQGERDMELRDMELPDMHMRDLVGIGHHFLPSEPTKWNVEDVYEFIRSLPGRHPWLPTTLGLRVLSLKAWRAASPVAGDGTELSWGTGAGAGSRYGEGQMSCRLPGPLLPHIQELLARLGGPLEVWGMPPLPLCCVLSPERQARPWGLCSLS